MRNSRIAVCQGLSLLVMLLCAVSQSVRGASISLPASRDNTIYSEVTDNSNGLGNLFAGYAGTRGFRRALMYFDLSVLPGNAVVQSAQLQMNIVKVPFGNIGPLDFSLFALTASWGEGTSQGSGVGFVASPTDATWTYNFFNTSSWVTPGGDFAGTASATTSLNGLGAYSWTSSQLTADVQSWINDPDKNNGWILMGGEADPFSAKEFTSREGGANGPTLTIVYTAVPATAGNYWIGNDTTRGGAGTWTNTGGTAWSATNVDGQTGLPWDQTRTATFGGTAAANAVAVSGAVIVNKGLLFTQDGYALSGSAGATLNLAGATPAINTITTSTGTAVLGVSLAGSNGMTKAGTGTLILNGINAFTGGTVLSAGDLRGTGMLQSSTVTTSANGNLWPGTSVIGSQVPAGGETMTVAGLNMSGGGKLKIALNASSQTSTQKVVVTGATCQLGGTLSLGIPEGATSANAFTVLSSSAGTITGTFSAVLLNGVAVTGASPVNVQYTSNAVTVMLTAGVTPVKLEAFEARAEGAGVAVSWTAVSEFQNAGFNVYRRALHDESWTRANPSLIGGRITDPDAKTYTFYDWTLPGVFEYRLESVGIQGGREDFARIAGPAAIDDMCDASIKVDGTEAAVVSADWLLKVLRARDTGASAAAAAPKLLAENRRVNRATDGGAREVLERAMAVDPLAGARWFTVSKIGSGVGYTCAKVLYDVPGLLRIPRAALPEGIDIGHVCIQREGRNIPVLAALPDGLLVFAPGYEDEYTNQDALFIRSTNETTVAGRAMQAAGLFASAQPARSDSPASVTIEYHDVYFDFDSAYRPYTFAPWFSSKYLTADSGGGTTQEFTVSIPGATPKDATLTVNLWSLTHAETGGDDHALTVLINGQTAGRAAWNGGGKMMQLAFQIPPGSLRAGDNAVELITPAVPGVESQIAFLHSMTVTCVRALDGSRPVIVTHSGAPTAVYEVGNLPSANVWVVDARYPDRAVLVPFETRMQADGTTTLRFTALSGGTGQFHLVPMGMENIPLTVSKRHVQPLKSTGVYLATGPDRFGAGVQPLLLQRAKEGLRGQFVDQEQLFDYYNCGRYGPAGIQKAVQSARPQYLLLLGRTTYDYKNYSGLNVDPLCPTFLVSTTFLAQATSDSMFGDLGRGYPEVAVGRLPVNDNGELSVAVKRILSYRGAPASGLRVHTVADRSDPDVANFPAQAAALSQLFPDMTWQANYLGETVGTAQEATAALSAAANGGADWLVYLGHGNSVRLGKEEPRILRTDEQGDTVKSWTGNAVFLQMTCTAHWMAKNETGFRSIAMQALTQPGGGISASIGSSTYVTAESDRTFMGKLMKNANSGAMRWGQALVKAQQWMALAGGGNASDMVHTEQLFGDPAMPVFRTERN